MLNKGEPINEKDLSALKQIPQEHTWLSQPHGNQEWSQGSCPPQSQREKDSLRINNDPLDQGSSRVHGVFPRGKSGSDPIFLCADVTGRFGSRIGHNNQQKSIELGIPKPAQTPNASLVSGTSASFASL